jgi:hypothetical protein
MCNLFIQIYNEKTLQDDPLETVKPVAATNLSNRRASTYLTMSHNDDKHCHVIEV